MADIVKGLRAIVTGGTALSEEVAGPFEHRTVNRIPVEMIREAADEIDRLRALKSPYELPATVASVDGVLNTWDTFAADDVGNDARGSDHYRWLATLAVDALAPGWVTRPPAELPATLTSVDDVRRVCEAAGLPWYADDAAAGGCGSAPYVEVETDPDGYLESVEVEQQGSDEPVARVNVGQPGWLLWHAIQAARSAS